MKLSACALIAVVLTVAACSTATNTRMPGRVAGSGGINVPEQRDKPYLIVISIDGFRWDYQDRYETPALDRLAARGIRAAALQPVFPTLTFPNHYSIATGLYPANHGLVANTFPDNDSDDWYDYKRPETVRQGQWYGGNPIWVAAEKSGLVSAAFFYVGTEADIGGVRPTYTHAFDSSIPGSRRVTEILNWLAMPAESRPHLLMLYFEHVDSATHEHGVDSSESIAAISQVDRHLGTLMDGIDRLPVGDDTYLIVVSDHGQSGFNRDAKVLVLDGFVDLDGISIVEGGAYAYLFFDEEDPARAIQIRDQINDVWRHGRAWIPEQTPSSWHVTAASRFPDVIVQPDPHFAVISSGDKPHYRSPGDHGWDPAFEDMQGIFLAAGPRLPKGEVLGPVSNLDVYPLMMAILGLPLTTPIDGNPDTLAPLLAPEHLPTDKIEP